jgi:hypothetical protein
LLCVPLGCVIDFKGIQISSKVKKEWSTWVVSIFLFVCSTGVQTQGLVLAKNALYHLSHIPSPYF